MSLNWRLSFFSPLFAITFFLAVGVGILLIVNPKACLRRRSAVIPKKLLRNARIFGIVLLAGVFIILLLIQLVLSI